MNSSMRSLAAEYDYCISVQKDVIARYREQLHIAQKKRDYKEVQRIQSLLHILYDEKYELEENLGEIKRYLGS